MENDWKIKIVLAAILAVATLVSVAALVSAVNKADHESNPATVNDTSIRN